MIKRTAAALVLLLSVACASSPLSSNSNAGAAGVGGGIPSTKNAPQYLLLSAPTLVREYDFSRQVYDFHVRGTMTNKGFYPAGDVQGKGTLCTEGKDWLSFSDLSVHKASDGSPKAPYLLGCLNANGTFTPASRTISIQ